jgi:flagellar FliL protein
MADENDELGEEGAEGAETPKKSKLMLFIILGLVLAGGGGGAWWFLKGKGGAKEAEHKAPATPAIYINLDPPFVVNFESEAMVRFLQVAVSLSTHDPHVQEMLKTNDPRIRNDLLLILGNQKYEVISTREGKETLRVAALARVRSIIESLGGEPAKVEDLYFTSFVMQ